MLLRKLLVQWGRHRGAQLLHLAHTDAVYYTSSTTAIAATTVIAATSITTAIAATPVIAATSSITTAIQPAARCLGPCVPPDRRRWYRLDTCRRGVVCQPYAAIRGPVLHPGHP